MSGWANVCAAGGGGGAAAGAEAGPEAAGAVPSAIGEEVQVVFESWVRYPQAHRRLRIVSLLANLLGCCLGLGCCR
jgi:hypothetical protein